MRFRPTIAAALLLVLIIPLSTSSLFTSQSASVQPGPVQSGPALGSAIDDLQRFTSDSSYYYSPALIQGVDGTAWVFYEYVYFNGRYTLPVISYQTSPSPAPNYTSSSWSGNQVLSSTPLSANINPSASQYRNGTIYVSFASNRTGNYNVFLKKYTPATGWGSDQQATVNTHDQTGSSVVAASDGSLWLFYDRMVNNSTANIFYKEGQGGVWPSQETPITNNLASIENQSPSAFQLYDGSIMLVWTSTNMTSQFSNLYYETYKNGVWSSRAQLTTGNTDSHGTITQDSNTTIWVSWNRGPPIGSFSTQNDIIYKYAVNGGSTWAPETNLTNNSGCGNNCPQDTYPYMAQLKDGRVYLFWSSTRDPQSYLNLYYGTTTIQPFHNVAVTAISVSPVKLRLGGIVTINVTVADTGTFPESFLLFVTATNTTSKIITVVPLSLGVSQSLKLSIAWNGSPVPAGESVITANIPPVGNPPDEMVTGDNTMSTGRIHLYSQGDVNYDGAVNIQDLALIAIAFGTSMGQPNYNPNADLNGDGKINILDLAICAYYYGTLG